MLAAWCLMLACCLLLDAWTPARPIHKGFHKGGAAEGRPPFVEAAEGRLPLWMGLAGVQASSSKQQASIRHQAASIKHQASSIKHQNQASVLSPINTPQKMKHFWPDRYRSFFGARLFLNLRFSDFRFWNMKNKVWYYQSGPKSVSINPYGIPEPPKPLRNCQSLDWVKKTKKFEGLRENLAFLNTRGGCKPQNSQRRDYRTSSGLSEPLPFLRKSLRHRFGN